MTNVSSADYKEQIDNFVNKYKDELFNVQINRDSVKKLIESLPNGKAIGIGSISNEMLKYTDQELIYDYISIIFTKMINTSTIPYHLTYRFLNH